MSSVQTVLEALILAFKKIITMYSYAYLIVRSIIAAVTLL